MKNMIQVQLVKSLIGRPGKHKRIIESLGLKKMNQTVLKVDNESIRGMIKKVAYLLDTKKK